ncbi:MAG TPA: S41 family peptidase [Vicinamibacterales bacterium]|nr:PD40 domain-containing protein [Acidobacteriota bacterium]HOC17471.1 S41 family peptidase [Vicinamibacterales bacterium]
MKTTLLRLTITLLALAGLATTAPAQPAAGWLRYPAISPDGQTIVFTYRGDLYRVPAAGGHAVPLTLHDAHDFMPVWSRDGRQIAFASDRHGNFDVFVIPAGGGEARRLTFHSADEFPYAFEPGDRAVVFGSARLDTAANRGYPTASQPELYRVPAGGGRVEQILTTPAEDVSIDATGTLFLYHDKKGGENAWRKHHTSAIARDIWAFDTKAGTHRKITTFEGEDRTPVLADQGKAFYYLSEESGSFNVHKMALQGGRSQQLTSFKKAPVRFLTSSASGLLCFGHDGEIYTMKPGAQPQKVAVALAVDARANARRVLPVTGGVRELAVAPSGKEVAFVFRGEVFVTSVDGGVTKRITDTPGQERGVSFSPDGKALLYASERGDRWRIVEARRVRDEEPYFYASTLIRETPIVANGKENYQPAYSPDGKEIAYIEDRVTLRVYNTESKQTRTLLTDRHLFSNGDADQYFQWSPDGRWILFDYAVPGFAPGEVGLVRADGTGEVINLTRSGFHDRGARWILGGKGMLWLSNRDGLRAAAQSGGAQLDAYAMFFTQEAWDRFRLTKEELALVKEIEEKREKEKKEKAEAAKDEEKKKDAKDKEAKPEEVVIDLDGIEVRKARLTIHSSSLGDALVSKDGDTLYYLARFEKGMNLWSTNLRTRETRMVLALAANAARLEWDKEQKNLFLLADGSLSKVDPATAKKEPISIKGEMVLDVPAEREFMFEHVWRRTARTFYTAGYHGADWPALKTMYQKHLAHVGNGHEFAELLSEMLGELNVSHSGARYARSAPEDDATAALGVFYDPAHRGAGYRIAEVVKDGPLDRAGVKPAPGTVIEAIDGEQVAANRDLAEFLNRKAGRNVLLTLVDPSGKRDVVVKPITLAEEGRLLYTRWVRRNQEEVDRVSKGRLGYIHVPGMNDGAYRSVFEEALGKYAPREGLVVDTRFNGGGDLVADLAMFLSGRKFFDYTTDTRSNGYEPNFRWTKPSVSLANEANYSDGHCYAYTVKALGLGKLVGMPVPGTCTFAGWEMLPDGSTRWGVPPLGVKNVEGQYLENRQTVPDIAVANSAERQAAGQDEQLEAAVAALLAREENNR